MAKTPRTNVVPVRFSAEEHRRVARAADRINASMSDYIRSATLIYTAIRWTPFFQQVLAQLVTSRALKGLDLTREKE